MTSLSSCAADAPDPLFTAEGDINVRCGITST
jgi:hypothetical protein